VFLTTDECRIDTVPKNAKTDRVIAVEPTGNSFLQKGIGSYIRDRLRTVGIDLDNQETNQELARLAEDWRLATIDLKAASDTVSIEAVWLLLPYEWSSVMDSFRSRWAVMPDESRLRLNKFSSMGNGFTFELETLIFWALTKSVDEYLDRRGTVAVYGDDIIVSRDIYPMLKSVLDYMGFETNVDKTFASGPFFESCGKHFFMGVDVTPAYQKEELTDASRYIQLGNRLMRLAFRLGNQKHLAQWVEPAWRCSNRGVSFQGQIPFGTEGDDAWLVPYSEFDFSHGRANHHGVRCLVQRTGMRSLPGNERALLAWSFRRRGDSSIEHSNHFLSYKGMDDKNQSSYGDVHLETSRVSVGFRRVIPDGKFSVRWE
jgi:hypothetical protein